MSEETQVKGAPEGVTFEGNDHAAPAAETPNPQPPPGVTFSGQNQNLSAPDQQPAAATPPAGVTFKGQAQPLPQVGKYDPNRPASAASLATGIGPRQGNWLKNWLEDLRGDVTNGTDTTVLGAAMKRLGATGSHGQGEGVMPNPIGGVARLAESIPDMYEMMGISDGYEAMKDAIKTGHLPSSEELKALNKKHLYAGARAINDIAGGIGEGVGATPLIIAPESAPALASGMVSAHVATKTAKALGADDETADAIGNVVGIITGAKVHSATEVSNFKVAANNAINADSIYKTRASELDIARDQANKAREEAIKTRKAYDDHQNDPQNNIAVPKQVVDDMQTRASEAAKNADNAQKAFDAANEAKAEAQIRLNRYSRNIQKKAADQQQEAANKGKKDIVTNRETMQKAIPAKGTDIYTPDENGNYPKYDIIRSHLEAAKDRGLPVDTIADARNAVEDSRQRIEKQIEPYIDKYGDEPLVSDPAESPKVKTIQKLDQMARVDGNFDNAFDEIDLKNVTDMTVKEAQENLTKLNNYMRATKKLTNNWDVYNQIETNPKFAAQFFLADEIRNALYDKLESHGVEGIRDARTETAALIDFRNAADAQLRRNAGGTKVRGSGNNGAIRNLIAKLTGKTIKGTGIALGAKAGGAPGAVFGGVIGDMIGEPVQDFIAPGDLTRDEHVAKSMKTRGTTRKPVEIKGEGTPAVIPPYETPPAVNQPADGPVPVKLVPRENTELHADLASHFGLTDLSERPYEELEQDLRQSIAEKQKAGVSPTPEEKKLMNRVLKQDAIDAATKAQAQRTAVQAATEKTPEQLDAEAELKKRAINKAEATTSHTPETLDLNQTLVNKGQAENSALVSHPAAAEAQAVEPAREISNVGKGLTSDMIHRHEWAHIGVGALDGLEPFEIRSDLHPEAKAQGAHAQAVFNADFYNPDGTVDPEALSVNLTKWLTMKMAGAASMEALSGMFRDDVMNHPAVRADIRQARSLIREVYPDLSNAQINNAINVAYDRAFDLLSKPHIADRIKANAAVREQGLHETLHASPARVNQFAEDLKKAHDENVIGPDGDGSGEGGSEAAKAGEEPKPEPEQPKSGKPTAAKEEKNAGRDSGRSAEGARPANVESSNTSGRARLTPPERSTGSAEADEAIRAGGGIPGGRQEGFKYTDKTTGQETEHPGISFFHDPETGTTLGLKPDAVTKEAVAQKIAESREQYAKAGKKETSNAANKDVADAADEYNKSEGRGAIDASVKPHSPEFAKQVADAYDAMKHDPTNPEVQKSYNAFADETKKQWDYATQKMGIKFEPWTKEGQPYANSKEMMADVKNNKHLYFFQGGDIKPESPMAKVDPETGLSYNDMFRAVHDLFGHAANGFEFGPKGEENAYLVHRQMFPQEAVPALTSETRGQNSWVNFGKHLRDEAGNVAKKGEPGYVAPADRPFAEQKVGLLPEEFHTEKPAETKTISESEFQNAVKHRYDVMHQTPDSAIRAIIKEYEDKGYKIPAKYWAEKIAYNLDEQPAGGINPNNPEAPSKRYGLELMPEVRKPLEGKPTAEDFRAYAQQPEVQQALAIHPDIKLGWDTTGAKPELNIGVSTDDLNTAKTVAKKLDQRDLWDNEKMETVPAGGKGEQTKFDDYPLEARLKELGIEANKQFDTSNVDASPEWKERVANTPWEENENSRRQLVVKKNGVEVGKLAHDGQPGDLYSRIRTSAIKPEYQDKGIGKEMYKSAIEDARKMGIREFRSDTTVSNQAQNVWKALAREGYPVYQAYTNNFNANGGGGVEYMIPLQGQEITDADFKPVNQMQEVSNAVKGSSVPLMKNPLEVEPGKGREEINTLDLTKALNEYSRSKLPALEPGSEPKAMVDRAKKLAEDEAKYQLAQSKTGTEWYTTEMKDHDKILQELRPELAEGETVDSPNVKGHPVNLTLFKAAEAILSSGQKPYANVKSALRAWDLYKETGEFPPVNPATGKSWGPRNVAAYANAFDSLNKLIAEKGEKGAAEWLLSEHPVSELRSYKADGTVSGKKDEMRPGATILGEKRGPFMQNLHGIESKFTADMWVSRSWNRWMGTLDLDPRIENKGKVTSESDAPRNNTERALMKESFEKAANKLGLTTSSMQAVLWYYEQALYRAHGLPVESWSFKDAAHRVAEEQKAVETQGSLFQPEAQDRKAQAGLENLVRSNPVKFVNLK